MYTDTHRCTLCEAGDDGAHGRSERSAVPGARSSLLDRLTEITLDDLFDAAGLARLRRTPLQRLLRPSARRFALVAWEFDQRVGEQGLAAGGAWLVRRMAAGVRVSGADRVPPSGPTVILANHPGMTDTAALFASLAARPDLRVVARERPFLRALPHVAAHLILVPDQQAGRMGVVRAGMRHLQQGGALLTFPAGRIEPDPATFGRDQAAASVRCWSDSFVLLARGVPDTRFVPAIVSHVISPASQRNVLTLLRRKPDDRQRLAAALQLLLPRYQGAPARVAFGPPAAAGAAGSLRASVIGEVLRLIDEASADPSGTGRADGPSGRGTGPQGREGARAPRTPGP